MKSIAFIVKIVDTTWAERGGGTRYGGEKTTIIHSMHDCPEKAKEVLKNLPEEDRTEFKIKELRVGDTIEIEYP